MLPIRALDRLMSRINLKKQFQGLPCHKKVSRTGKSRGHALFWCAKTYSWRSACRIFPCAGCECHVGVAIDFCSRWRFGGLRTCSGLTAIRTNDFERRSALSKRTYCTASSSRSCPIMCNHVSWSWEDRASVESRLETVHLWCYWGVNGIYLGSHQSAVLSLWLTHRVFYSLAYSKSEGSVLTHLIQLAVEPPPCLE